MSKEINMVPAANAAPSMPRPKFGVRVSKDVPEFEFADKVFKTRLIGVSEELALTRHEERFTPKVTEEGEAATESTEQEISESLAEIVSDLLKSRLVGGEPSEITTQWAMDNMQIRDVAPLLYLLRTGKEQPELPPLPPVLQMAAEALAAESAEEAADPNAES